MSDELVTVTTVMNGTEAQFTVNRLNEAGIEATIADENFVTMDFLMGAAVGFIKVQVREKDADRAVEILEAARPVVDEKEIPWDQPPDELEEDDEETLEDQRRKEEERKAPVVDDPISEETESLVYRAYRCAVLGLFTIGILNLFSAIILKEANKQRERFSDTARRRATIAFWANVFALLTFGVGWVFLVFAVTWELGALVR